MPRRELHEVAVIGAGPAGAIAAALLHRQGVGTLVLEAQHFPRFSIGESLLPHCMLQIDQAGMTAAVESAGFQRKDGARFARGNLSATFDFTSKFGAGPGTTFEVKRADFDQLLADEAARQGVEIRYGHRIEAVRLGDEPLLSVATDQGERFEVQCRFILDASGFGRALPRLLGLERPSDFPLRAALFTHLEDRISAPDYDRNKIFISVHPEEQGVWYWLIPFSDGRASLGVVAEPRHLQRPGQDPAGALQMLAGEEPSLARLLAGAAYDSETQTLAGYAANVSALWGPGYALLGNAGEFLDPVFSSGVTIAMQSAGLAAPLVARQLGGGAVDWEREYAAPLKAGVDTFRVFVEAWYDGSFQDVIFAPRQNPEIRAMLCAILAGYAWNLDNPYVAQTRRRLKALVALCRGR